MFCTTYCTTALGEEREVVESWRILNNDKVGKAEWVGVKKWEYRCTLTYIAEVEVEMAEKTGNFLHMNMPKEVEEVMVVLRDIFGNCHRADLADRTVAQLGKISSQVCPNWDSYSKSAQKYQ